MTDSAETDHIEDENQRVVIHGVLNVFKVER
jgi:hypothetical protein